MKSSNFGKTQSGSGKGRAYAKKSNGILYVLVFSNVEKDMVADVLAMHPGNTPCQAQVKQNGVSKLMEFSQHVEICPDLLSRLEDVLGANRVKYVEKGK